MVIPQKVGTPQIVRKNAFGLSHERGCQLAPQLSSCFFRLVVAVTDLSQTVQFVFFPGLSPGKLRPTALISRANARHFDHNYPWPYPYTAETSIVEDIGGGWRITSCLGTGDKAISNESGLCSVLFCKLHSTVIRPLPTIRNRKGYNILGSLRHRFFFPGFLPRWLMGLFR